MSYRALLAWSVGVFIAAGIESAVGTGMPGPLLLLAVAAGFSSGIMPGVIIGALAGCCSAALGGMLFSSLCIGIGCGMAAGFSAKFFARRSLIVAMFLAALFSFVLCVLLGLTAGLPMVPVLQQALVRSGGNALWIFPIYGIVLVVYARHSSVAPVWR